MGSPRKPSPLRRAEIEKLMEVLRGVDGDKWITAGEISMRMYGIINENTKRRVRLIAGAARPAVFSYNGSPGYKLWSRCTTAAKVEGIALIMAQGRACFRDANVFTMALNLETKINLIGNNPQQLQLL